jgi:hypothetical protein
MGTLERFLLYAADFEKTLADDDWSRLTQYFSPEAVYRVESNLFGCELHGPSAIFAGIKKSLDGFDRKFTEREIEITQGPELNDEGNELRASWTVTYQKGALPPFVLRGKSMVRNDGDEITLLVDSYDDEVADEATAWMQETGEEFDPRYV